MHKISKHFGKQNIKRIAVLVSAFIVAGTACVFPLRLKAGNEYLPHLTGGGYSASGQISGAGYSSQIYDASSGLPTSDANYILC